MKKYIFLLLLSCSMAATSQTKHPAGFSPPFDFPLVLSGNFGEIRSNHFHAGLDFKTQGVSGKKVLAMGDGYISNVRVTHSSGYVLDVAYDTGYTTVLVHNQGFMPPVAQRVKDLQYEKESWEVGFKPEVNEYRVKAGQPIAWSGNMGYSFGPHLHLEVRETETGDRIDPLPFFKSGIKDTRPPQATGFMLFPQLGEGAVNGTTKPYPFQLNDRKHLEAWGVIGSGIRAYDYMDGVNNRYGVYQVTLIVDGKEVFTSTVDRFSSDEDRMINAWTYGQYMKSFLEPGNKLRMLRAMNDNRGLITIDEERNYHFQYILKDLYGNTSRYSFVVTGKKQEITPVHPKKEIYFAWDKVNFLKRPGLDLLVPRHQLYDNVVLNYSVRRDTNAVAFVYQLNDERIPLHGYADLQIGLLSRPVADMSKYYIARVSDKGKFSSAGGKYENGFMKTRIRELGTYTVAIDTIPPEITPVAKESWAKTQKVTYKIKEKETGIRSYRGTIDGEYALFALHIMSDRLVCELDPKRIKKGGTHELVITVTDNCGNESTVNDTFIW